MSRLESLPPDLHAVLSLVLRQRKSYAEIAVLLGIAEHAVHDRAHSALALLAPRQARGLSAPEREQVGEYLLAQQSASDEHQTRRLLERSAPGRSWAQALSLELGVLSAQPLPAIPAPTSGTTAATTAAPAAAGSGAEQPPAPSSRVGGAVILGGLAAVAIVVVLLIVGVGSGGGSSGGTHANTTSTSTEKTASAGTHTSPAGTTAPAGTSTNSGAANSGGKSTGSGASSTTGAKPTPGKPLTLTPPDPATSKAIGIAYVLTQKGEHAFYVFTKGLPAASSGAFYAIWLEEPSSGTAAYPLGSLPAQGPNGLIEGGGPLPSSAGNYSRIIVTRETTHHPAHPGPTVLGGPFTLG